MRIIVKGTGIFFVTVLALGLLSLWFQTYLVGQLYLHAGTITVLLGGAAPIFVVGIAGYIMYFIAKFDINSFLKSLE